MHALSVDHPLPVAQARSGDAEAWDVLLRRFRLPLYAYAFEWVRQEQAALDIVQETFINAARHVASLRHDDRFGAWLFGIAHQKCLQHARRRPDALPLDLERNEPPDTAPGPRQWLIRREQEAAFMKCLDRLALAHRTVLTLHFVEEFSLEEIAEITQTPVGTVKSRLHYARKAFKHIWEEQNEGPA
jgi:RNA polymerase sigma-70 factor (ECF subfamily)